MEAPFKIITQSDPEFNEMLKPLKYYKCKKCLYQTSCHKNIMKHIYARKIPCDQDHRESKIWANNIDKYRSVDYNQNMLDSISNISNLKFDSKYSEVLSLYSDNTISEDALIENIKNTIRNKTQDFILIEKISKNKTQLTDIFAEICANMKKLYEEDANFDLCSMKSAYECIKILQSELLNIPDN